MTRLIWIAAAVFILNGTVRANEKIAPSKWPVTQIYLSDGAVNVEHAVPPPPVAASAEDKKDSEVLHHFQESRTKKECARAETEVRVSLDHFFGPAYGPLTEKEVRAWTPFFKTLTSDSDYYIQKVKKYYKRPRPYLEDTKINPCITKEGTLSYPSGHAAISRVFASTLGLIDPARRQTFKKRANQLADDRVLGGVHHPTDIVAGKMLGDEIFEAFSRSEKFKKDLAALPKP